MGGNRIPLVIMPVSVLSAQYLLSPSSSVSLSFSCCLSNGLFPTTAEYKRCRLRSVSPHFKMLLLGRVKGYGTPVQHQFNFSCGWDEISVFLDSSYVRFVSRCGNYCADSPSEILLIFINAGFILGKAPDDTTEWMGFCFSESFHLRPLTSLQ